VRIAASPRARSAGVRSDVADVAAGGPGVRVRIAAGALEGASHGMRMSRADGGGGAPSSDGGDGAACEPVPRLTVGNA
jgi:hypothetical protein